MFLTINDLKTVSQESIIMNIVNNEQTIISDIINDNIALMTDYLSVHYDCNEIFTKEDKQRNRTVLRYLKALVLYDLYCSNGHHENDMARQRYDDAMSWLKQIRDGKQIIDNLYKITDSNGDNSLFLSVKSNKNYKSNW